MFLLYGSPHFDVTLEVSEYIVVCTDLTAPDKWIHTAIFRSFEVVKLVYTG